MVDFKRYCTVVGCILVINASCVPGYFGNLMTYTISFLYFCGLYDESNVGDENWILAVFVATLSAGSFLSGFLSQKLSIKCSLIVPSAILISGMCLTYYTVSYSLWSVAVSYGSILGLAGGSCYPLAIYVATQTFPERVGTVTSVILMGMSSWGILFNAMITFLINPKNFSPNVELNQYRIFNQTEIIANVPSTFIYLGIVSGCMQILGILLIFKPELTHNDKYVELKESPTAETDQEVDMTTMEMLKDVRAYILWFIGFFGDATCILIQAVYKSFGQTFIEDDQFLATVGSSAAFTSTVFRLFLGIAADRCGIKITFLMTYIPSIILSFTIYQVQFLHRIWYLIWVNALSCLLSNVFILTPIAVKTIFGSGNFLLNFAIIWSGAGVGGFTVPLILKVPLSFGWQTVFYVIGGLICACTGLTILLKLPLPLCRIPRSLLPYCGGFKTHPQAKE